MLGLFKRSRVYKGDISHLRGRWYLFDFGDFGWGEAKILEELGDRLKVELRDGTTHWAYRDWYYHPIRRN